MIKNKLFIPGWELRYDLNTFNYHYIATLQVNYDIKLFQKYIFQGNFLVNNPFGIYMDENQLIIFSDLEIESILIANYPITLKLIQKPISWDGMGLEIYAFTYLYNMLVKYDYFRQIEKKTMSGKSRGELSHKNPVKKIQKKINGQLIQFSLLKSELFETYRIETNKVIIFYYPKHKITDDKFGFNFSETIEILLENEWNNLYRTPDEIIKRYLEINKIVTKEQSFSNGIWKNIGFNPLTRLNRPICITNSKEYNFRDNLDLTFKEMMSNIDLFNETSKIKIQIILDKVDNFTEENKNQIQNYITKLCSLENFETINISNILEYNNESIMGIVEQLNENNADAAFLILNNEIKGYEYIYDLFKSNILIPTKVVTTKTILSNENELSNSIKLLWLGLRTRIYKNQLQKIKGKDNYNILSLNVLPFVRGDFLVFIGFTIRNGQFLYYSKLIYNKNKSKQKPSFSDLKEILNNLLLNNLGSKKLLVLIKDESLNRIISKIDKSYNVVPIIIKESNSVMLMCIKEDEYHVPYEGSYFQMDSNKYLLLTNGKPNDDFAGVPKPLLIEIGNETSLNVEDHINILETIYHHTFLHTFSLSKPKLPFELHVVNFYPSSQTIQELLTKRITKEVPF